MALPSLATIDDIQELAPDLADNLDETQAGRLLGLASALVRKEADRDWVDETGTALEGVPDGIPELVASVVIRTLRAPDPGVTQQTVGSWSESYAREAASYGVFLFAGEKEFVRKLAGSGGPKAFSISTYGKPGWLGRRGCF